MNDQLKFTYIGGPTALLELDGLKLLRVVAGEDPAKITGHLEFIVQEERAIGVKAHIIFVV